MVAEQKITNKTGFRATDGMFFRLSGFFLKQIVRDSRLTVICRDTGRKLTVGRDGGEVFGLSVDTAQTLWTLVSNPDPGAGEAFMDGAWEMTEGDIGRFIVMMARNLQNIFNSPMGFLLSAVLRKKLQSRVRDEANSREFVQRHYDIGNDLYELFLDEGMNYSCAFFDSADMSLRDAQLNKLRTTIIDRLKVSPDMRMLDIGCGWGEACRIAVGEAGAKAATGVTLAKNQLAIAQQRAQGMPNPPTYLLEDYRAHATTHAGAYDRILSIGMFEHVGEENYRTYFGAIRDQLAPGGRALVHSIVNATTTPGGMINGPWLERYIFPGGRIPDLPEMLEAAAAEGLRVVQTYLQPPSDYAETVRRWRANFVANEARLDPAKYDTRFRHMWIYYLALCEAMFDGIGFQIGQVVFERADA